MMKRKKFMPSILMLESMKKTIKKNYTSKNIEKMAYQANHEVSKQYKREPQLAKEYIDGVKAGMKIASDSLIEVIESYEKML